MILQFGEKDERKSAKNKQQKWTEEIEKKWKENVKLLSVAKRARENT